VSENKKVKTSIIGDKKRKGVGVVSHTSYSLHLYNNTVASGLAFFNRDYFSE
jgi:hypothetical protein